MKPLVLALVICIGCGSSRRSAPPRPSPADPDPDGDRIVGADDLCPDDPEPYNGVDDTDGCPDKPGARTDCVWNDVIHIPDRLFFDGGSAMLPDRAIPIVDAVAATLVGNPPIERVGVVGGRAPGEPDRLAAERAAAVVRALTTRGVAASRLEAHGHLQAIDRDTARSRAVWFVILRIEGQDTRPATGNERWLPWERDCAASWKAHRDHGALLDCDCVDARPPE